MFKSLSDGYELLWKSIIRPPREKYRTRDLGPTQFFMEGFNYIRTDFSVISSTGCKMRCSHFEPVEEEREHETLPCVIFVHGNSSSRIEGLVLVPLILPVRATVVCLDWAGCGKSEGEFITLGWNERHDLDIVINYLRAHRRVGVIGLWGRSMGAVSALFSACNNLDIGSMVLDSPFASMKTLAHELAKKHSGLPKFILKFVYGKIRDTIREKAGFDINELKPINMAPNCLQPALFLTAKGDDFVPCHHTQEVFEAYAGDKDILYVDGDHNSSRPNECLQRIARFFYSTLLCDRIPKRIKTVRKRQKGQQDLNDDAMLRLAIQESLEEFNKIRGSV
jgi:pimeloyl-ACP methyl ester carboxylesterase